MKLALRTVGGMMNLRASLCTTLLALASMSAACGGDSAGRAEIITIDGSSTVYPVTEAVAEAFQAAYSGMRVTVGESGTGAGMQKFCRSETVISNASRPISATEAQACRAAGITYLELPVAYDGLSVIVHPDNTWVTSITVAELRRIWEESAQGTIVRWNQVRPDWPDRELHLFGPGTASGTFDYFTEAINGKAKSSRGDYTASESDNVLVQGVATDPNSLGYFGLAYYEHNQDRLKLVPVDDEDPTNGDGPITPSVETVRNGTYRPLSRPLFIYVNLAAMDRSEVQQFVEFYLNSPAQLLQDVGYVPLAEAEQTLTRARMAARTPGTMFEGATHTTSLEALLRGDR
ncbi:MAG TPA: PstS family phosphate ABC transporter substrate-binding protein [Vicinamibacterales bacterium]|nr:PstS family phosphate ABC transporter substrate-binding protein [Vicinamibacterales bacterium]